MDFILVETIRHLRELGIQGLGLNFAVMRRVLAGETGGVAQKLERSVLKQMSHSMQIESLWRFNAKYNPDWRPRYLVYEGLGDLPAAAVAIARAESVWELPVVGRFLAPDRDSAPPSQSAPDSATAAPSRVSRSQGKRP